MSASMAWNIILVAAIYIYNFLIYSTYMDNGCIQKHTQKQIKQIHAFYTSMLIIVHYYADISIYTHISENRYDFYIIWY